MTWCKIDTALHRNPKVRMAGADAREVFLFIVLANAETSADGVVGAHYADVAFLADALGRSEETVRNGLKRCVTFRLLRVENDEISIVGWDGEWRTKNSTDRVRKHRERKKNQTLALDETLRNVTETLPKEKKHLEREREREKEKERERESRDQKVATPIPRQALDLASILAKAIALRLPGSKADRQPDACAKSWAPHFDKLHRLDRWTWNEIRDVLDWSQADDFWQSNILSGKKLREKFDQLKAQMSKRPDTGHRKPEQSERKLFASPPPPPMTAEELAKCPF